MYKIKTSDQKEHGPYMGTVVQQWIAAGKTDDQTLLRKVGESYWRPVNEFVEFGGRNPETLESAVGTRRSRTGHRSGSTSCEPPTSSMAVASLVLGVLGVTAPLGLILGIIAQLNISRGSKPLKGAGYAISGMVVSGIMLLFGVPILIALLVPDWVRAQEKSHEEECLKRAGLIAVSLDRFSGKHEGKYPNYETWCDDLFKDPAFGYSRVVFVCPAEPQMRSAFAMNTNLIELTISNIHPRTVLFFESNAGWNGHGGFAQLASSRHRGRAHVGFADGSVKAISVWQVPQLRWLP